MGQTCSLCFDSLILMNKFFCAGALASCNQARLAATPQRCILRNPWLARPCGESSRGWQEPLAHRTISNRSTEESKTWGTEDSLPTIFLRLWPAIWLN